MKKILLASRHVTVFQFIRGQLWTRKIGLFNQPLSGKNRLIIGRLILPGDSFSYLEYPPASYLKHSNWSYDWQVTNR